MANERLGIFEELAERRERYAQKSDSLRARILGVGPITFNGPHAETTNPFTRGLRVRSPGGRFHETHDGWRRRAIWPEAKFKLNLVTVVQAVVIESRLTVADMMGDSRKKHIAWPRHVAMWAVDRYCPDYSLAEIAYVFRRDHTTVMHGIQATNDRLRTGNAGTRILVANVQMRLHTIAQAR